MIITMRTATEMTTITKQEIIQESIQQFSIKPGFHLQQTTQPRHKKQSN